VAGPGSLDRVFRMPAPHPTRSLLAVVGTDNLCGMEVEK
jgi:hypothetical protein